MVNLLNDIENYWSNRAEGYSEVNRGDLYRETGYQIYIQYR